MWIRCHIAKQKELTLIFEFYVVNDAKYTYVSLPSPDVLEN